MTSILFPPPYRIRGWSETTARMGTAVLTGLLLSSPAWAHSARDLQGGFFTGFMHPLSGPDHLLAMVAVGLWGAILGRPLIYVLPVVFPIVMAAAAVVGMAGIALPPVEYGIAASVLILGASITFAWAPPAWLAALVVAFFALFHGYAHGLELPSMANPVAFAAGFVTATGSLHLAGIGLGEIDKRPGGRRVVRVMGSFIMIAGLVFMWLAVR